MAWKDLPEASDWRRFSRPEDAGALRVCVGPIFGKICARERPWQVEKALSGWFGGAAGGSCPGGAFKSESSLCMPVCFEVEGVYSRYSQSFAKHSKIIYHLPGLKTCENS